MSRLDAPDPDGRAAAGAIETVIVPRTGDIGGFAVRRALPSRHRRMVGPFIFLDQMGPARLAPSEGLDVAPHPHIGLATVTYLFEGAIVHRDNLGTEQVIRPGAVNWMTAGRGIAHSERSSPEDRAGGAPLFGVQTWVALPRDREETAAAFAHHDAALLPVIEGEGKRARLIVGSLWGGRSPVAVFSDTVYADVALDPGARLAVPTEPEERAVFVVSGRVSVAGDAFDDGALLVLRPGDPVTVVAEGAARILLVGGAAMDGPRYIWWNFVSSSKERIEQAKADWRARRFDPVPGDDGYVPLPER